ncbi:leucine-rich repeat transmembrane protein kinase protein, partial [Tanacetum coccineum]
IAQGTNYTDSRTGLNYVSDAGFIDSGVSGKILPSYNSKTLDFQITTLTSFPQATRNCYTLRPKQGKGNRYLIRARFTYGNYDFKGQPLKFAIYLGSDYWDTVDFTVSLGLGNPFISALELRILDSNMYGNRLESMVLSARTNFGTSETLRDKPAV